MKGKSQKSLDENESKSLIQTLKKRFEKNMNRHQGMKWEEVEQRVLADEQKLWTLNEMEKTGGEPDVVDRDKKSGAFLFFDCAEETPKGRRSYCYDYAAWESRKEHRPANNAVDVAADMGITLLDEAQYQYLQTLGRFDLKTSSWLKTPEDVRELGGAIFGDCRFGRVFIYHNGASSYYAARAFRGCLIV